MISALGNTKESRKVKLILDSMGSLCLVKGKSLIFKNLVLVQGKLRQTSYTTVITLSEGILSQKRVDFHSLMRASKSKCPLYTLDSIGFVDTDKRKVDFWETIFYDSNSVFSDGVSKKIDYWRSFMDAMHTLTGE